MTFHDMLDKRWAAGARVCVGLDPAYKRLPAHITEGSNVGCAILGFNSNIIEQTGRQAYAYKPNVGFYIAQGWRGIKALEETCLLIGSQFPDVPIILDGKFGDIGATAEQYAEFAFEVCKAHAVTLNPYLGIDAVAPFAEYEGKGLIILCRTSNKSAGEFQDLQTFETGAPYYSARPLYQYIAQQVAWRWNGKNNCALVVGATYPDELKCVRQIVGDNLEFLVPGIGTQGGDLEASLRNGVDSRKRGITLNAASSIIFAKQPGVALGLVTDEINRVLTL